MPDKKSSAESTGPISAADLRMKMLEAEMKKAEKATKAKEKDAQKKSDFAASFLESHVSEAELAVIRRLVMSAAQDGKTEAMVYSFPSDLCTDGGRAINSNDPAWPKTLRGKAKELFQRYEAMAKPQGYRLKAMIINFPGGMPGDVGFFISWGG